MFFRKRLCMFFSSISRNFITPRMGGTPAAAGAAILAVCNCRTWLCRWPHYLTFTFDKGQQESVIFPLDNNVVDSAVSSVSHTDIAKHILIQMHAKIQYDGLQGHYYVTCWTVIHTHGVNKTSDSSRKIESPTSRARTACCGVVVNSWLGVPCPRQAKKTHGFSPVDGFLDSSMSPDMFLRNKLCMFFSSMFLSLSP